MPPAIIGLSALSVLSLAGLLLPGSSWGVGRAEDSGVCGAIRGRASVLLFMSVLISDRARGGMTGGTTPVEACGDAVALLSGVKVVVEGVCTRLDCELESMMMSTPEKHKKA